MHGIDTDHNHATDLNDDYTAVTSIVQRIQPDIICFQELTSTDKADWLTAAASLGYPYYVIPTNGGTFSGSLMPGIWSKYPIVASSQVKETNVDATAAMFTRWPLHAVIEVPGALQPFHLYVIHNKSSTENKQSRLWRALETYRTVSYITNMIAQYPLDSEYAIMGDWNDSIEGSVGLGQNTSFDQTYYLSQQAAMGNATVTFNAGSDIPWETNAAWPLPYKMYPTERMAEAGLTMVDATHTGSTNTWTHDNHTPPTGTNGFRLDYILFSDEIINNAYGPPAAEVYNSAGDGPGVGLSKPGPQPASDATLVASDHRMVFSDFNLIDEVGGISPVGIISEIVDHPTLTNANYVEICNTGIGTLDLSTYKVAIYLDKNRNAATNIQLSGSLDSGQVYTLTTSTSTYFSTYGVAANKQNIMIGQLNGNDVVALVRSNSVSDIYGKTRVNPTGWGYTNSTAVRNQGVSDPATVWTNTEWTLTAGTNTATPGVHQSLPDADVSVAGVLLSPFAPKATNDFAVQGSIFRNRAATNLTVTAKFRINGGSWIQQAMTNSSGYVYKTPAMSVAKNGGDVMEYYIQVAFYDYYGVSSNSPKVSATNIYTFPAGTGTTARVMPLFNEVQANGNGTDTNEFVELIAPAGTNLIGYTMKQYNGATNLDGAMWTYTFPSFTVPDDGILDFGSNHLGFVVISTNASIVTNTDLLMTNTLNNGPNALILYDPDTNIVDAVVWLAASSNTFDTDVDDPGTVSRLVPSGSPSYLHNIGVDQDTDFCPQAPNNVLLATTGTWESALATPGALNVHQTNSYLFVARLDLDQDGVLDDEDNCPSYNPTQVDTDGDGQGDECDADIDGDGVLNGVDNCPYNSNPGQGDLDLDSAGDECDDDIDGDGLTNEDDPDPYTPTTQIFNFESPTNLSKGTYATLTPELIARRYWVLSNAVISSSASDLTNGTKSLRLRAPGEFILQGALTNGIATLSFSYGRAYTDAGTTIAAEYKKGTNGWTTIASVSTTGITNLTTNTATVNVLGPVEFRITCTGTTDLRANVDDIAITEYTLSTEPMTAQCALVGTNEATYDGYAHLNDFIVYPEGIGYSVVYTMASVPTNPVGLGTYTATVTIPDTNVVTGGTFVFTDSVVIVQGVATCALDSAISAAYDGAAHTNAFTVTPGMAWSVDYSPATPVEPGSYDATVTVTGDANATGGAFVFSNAVVITQALATCSLDSRITTNYNGTAHTNHFTVTPGLAWSVDYSPAAPVNIGIYNATVSVAGDAHYVGVTGTFAGAVAILSTNSAARPVGSPFTIDFESPYAPTASTYGPHTNKLSASYPTNWFINNGYRNSTASDVTNGMYSLRLRFIDVAATSNGVLQSVIPFSNGIHSVAFNYAMYGNDSAATLSLQTSANGSDWTAFTNLVVDSIHTNFAAFSNTLSRAQAAYLRFQLVDGSSLDKVNLDDILVMPYDPLAATVSLSNLSQTYNGTARAATATTAPGGLNVNMTYSGAVVPPTNAGSYTVVATVASPGYAGATTGTLVVARAVDSITFSNTNQFYSGSPCPVTAIADSGSSVSLTYNGSGTAPATVGTYAVTGIVNAVNWMKTNTTTLTISAVDTVPVFDPLGVQTAYIGAATSFTVSATGYPAPTLALQGTTASSGYSFTPGTGQLDYTPPQADVGSRSFTFTASNSVGVDTQVVSVGVNEGVPAAPASIWAGTTNTTDFTAAWSAVSGATDYRLDVSTNAAFGGGGGGGSVYAVDFENGSKGSYAAGDVALNGISWNLNETVIGTTAGSDRFNGAKAARVRSNETVNAGILSMNADTNMGLSSITLFYAKYGADANTAGRVDYSTNSGASWISAGTFDATATNLALFSATNLNVAGNVRVRVVKTSGTSTRYNIDDITLYPYAPLPASFLSGYSNRTVSGTSQSVTGLTAGATYYFRARAVSPGGTGTYSSVANVTTLVGTPPTMNAIAAQTATVAVDFVYTVTATQTDGDPILSFACTSTVDEAAWAFDTNSGDFHFLSTTNQIGANVFNFTALDKDGTSSPAAMTVTVSTTPFQQWVMGRGRDPGNSNFAANADYDLDGMTTWEEYLADTDPATNASVLEVTGSYNTVTHQINLKFPASTGRYYQLEYCTNLTNSAAIAVSNLGWGVPGMVITNAHHTNGSWYWAIRARLTNPP